MLLNQGLIWKWPVHVPSLLPALPPTFPTSFPPPHLPEVPAVISIWIAVFGHHHPVGKLPSCQTLHGLLGVKNWHEFHKDLQKNKNTLVWSLAYVYNNVDTRQNNFERQNQSEALPTLPVPGTSRPSTGRGISMLLTWPYLLHSSLTSSTISSYSSSSSSSSGATMFIRHSTSVGRPPIWVTELFRPGTCSVTGVWFILVWKNRKGYNRVINLHKNLVSALWLVAGHLQYHLMWSLLLKAQLFKNSWNLMR